MQRVSFGFTHYVTGDLGYIWDDAVLAIMFGPESGRKDYTVHDIRKGGLPQHFTDLGDALNAMLTIAARDKASL